MLLFTLLLLELENSWGLTIKSPKLETQRHHTSNFKIKERGKPKHVDPVKVLSASLWPPISHRTFYDVDIHIPPINCWRSFCTASLLQCSLQTTQQSLFTLLSLKKFLFLCFEKCYMKLEISGALFMFKDRFKQWGDIRLGRVFENKDNLYLIWRKKSIIWKMLWVDKWQNTHTPI